MSDIAMARMLGWASIGIGLTEIAAPRAVENLLGIGNHGPLLASLGMREIASGVAILSQDAPTPQLASGLWSRVAGDALDLALLGAAATRTTNPAGLGFATAMVLGITALDALYAQRITAYAADRDADDDQRMLGDLDRSRAYDASSSPQLLTS